MPRFAIGNFLTQTHQLWQYFIDANNHFAVSCFLHTVTVACNWSNKCVTLICNHAPCWKLTHDSMKHWRPVCRDSIWLSVFTSFNSLAEQHDSTKSLCVTSGQQRMKALITLWLPLSTSAVSSDCDACYSLRKSFLKQWRSSRLSTKVLTFLTLKPKAQRIRVGRLEAKGVEDGVDATTLFLSTNHNSLICSV